VLDLSRVLAGPIAGRMLADLGADVVKVEPPEGDITRGWGQIRHGLGGYYVQQNVGKRAICVDLTQPGGAELVKRLASKADVLLENFRPHVMAQYGLGWDALRALNPRLVMLSISGFGAKSPEAHRPAYAPVLHAETGALLRQAELDRAPRIMDFVLSNADTNAGLHGLVAVLAALHLRERTGEGQHIDLAMLDAMLATDDYAHFALDEHPITRGGGEVWDAAGGPILVTGEFRNLWRVLTKHCGVSDPTPAGAPLAEKIRARREAAAKFYASFPTREALTAELDRVAIPWGDVRSVTQAFESPTARARGTATSIDDRAGGARRVVQSPYRFSDAASGARGNARYRGEDNRDVLGDWLAASPSEIDGLERAGVLLAEARE
jgi:crotonobetainyl-CoA:carnitine CoA-transferase CaiB-like acyl-CoA transferase